MGRLSPKICLVVYKLKIDPRVNKEEAVPIIVANGIS